MARARARARSLSLRGRLSAEVCQRSSCVFNCDPVCIRQPNRMWSATFDNAMTSSEERTLARWQKTRAAGYRTEKSTAGSPPPPPPPLRVAGNDCSALIAERQTGLQRLDQTASDNTPKTLPSHPLRTCSDLKTRGRWRRSVVWRGTGSEFAAGKTLGSSSPTRCCSCGTRRS